MQGCKFREILVLFFCVVNRKTGVHGITQSAQINVQLSNGEAYMFYASQASFGPSPKMGAENNAAYSLALPPQMNPMLCTNETVPTPDPTAYQDSFLLVPRGECTFEVKAINAQRLGAVGIIVRGTLASRYSRNESTNEIIYPTKFHDYDCAKGRAEIPASLIQLGTGSSAPDGVYNADQNDPVLSGSSTSNLCRSNSPDNLYNCPSQACLLTGNKTTSTYGSGEVVSLEACCAWDLHIWLYNDPIFAQNDVTIPAVYVTFQQGKKLLDDMQSNKITVVVSSRVRPSYNMAAILIWALGVFVCAVAAYASASEYRNMAKVFASRNERSTNFSGEQVALTTSAALSPSNTGNVISPRQSFNNEDTLELNAGHAFGFIVMASSGLMILFVFKVYAIVKIMYTFGCSRAVMQVIFIPIFEKIFQLSSIKNKVLLQTNIEDIGDITTIDTVAGLCAYSVGFVWLFMALTVHHPEESSFFWITQDIFGACMCIMFLSLIKLNSMRVAAILLIVAFFYDIFFVFITPLIFKGESVMITVATSGGPPKADPSWCEKYPDDANCQGGDPLPMLLTIPRINDYLGGSSLLGLGDIVLPGLLLSFAARMDAAKNFMGIVGGGGDTLNNKTGCSACFSGYFYALVVAYAIGLFMANAAVYLMNMGQPALLYLVPMCLGTFCYLGWKRNELLALWEGPRLIKTADAMLYGEYESLETDVDHLEAAQPSPAQDLDRVDT